ncbi:MAG: four-carbon acid sugar kinase family protein [Clostridia bacterium]|jgi:uncharacterized protein YgbK (DUF1537 family)|nr:four-carbon acid sugar kinase family protein [Clostridia bacterium]
MKLLVIADDFTGAVDTGVQFSEKGIATVVSTCLEPDFAAFREKAQVLVVDTESRHLSCDEAYRRVFRLAESAWRYGISYLYKKTDSTLRGNIGAELNAVLDASAGGPLMFVPAYPQTGRTTLAGRQYVQGIPLEETVYARDPFNPVHTGSIKEILGSCPDVQTTLALGSGIVWPELDRPGTVYVFDASTEEDMKNIGDRLKDLDKLALTAGCAGFAEYLAALLPFVRRPVVPPCFAVQTLVLCGSVNETSLKQLHFAESLGWPTITLSREQMHRAYWDRPPGENFLQAWDEQLRERGTLVIKTVNNKEEVDRTLPAREIAGSLGKIAGQLLEKGPCRNLVIFGGDTAIGAMEALMCDALTPSKEILPGVAVATAACKYKETVLVTKAGGFGPENVLQLILEYIKEQKPSC